MEYRNSRRKPVLLGEAIGRGGEATIYKVAGQAGMLAKLYERPPRSEYARKLVWMRDHPPLDPTAAQQHASLAWPVDLLFNPRGQLAGYLMPYIEKAVSLLDVFNPRQCAKVLPEFNRRYLHRAARNLAAALGALHARGYVVGDLNESNILVTPRALVTMIDTDSFQVREPGPSGGLVHTCPVARLEYTPPELQGKSLQNTERFPEQDAFGLGVLIYQLLMNGNHPFRALWLGAGEPPPLEERIRQGCFPFRNPPTCPVAPPQNTPNLDLLHPAVADLVLRCFVDGHRNPRKRPTPDLWERAIGVAEDNLVACRNGHYYSNHLSECPVCYPRWSGRQIPLPAVRSSLTSSLASPSRTVAPAPLPPSQSGSPGGVAGKNPSPSHAGAVSPSTPLHNFLERIQSWMVTRIGWRTSTQFHRRSTRFTRQTLLESLWKGALLGSAAGALGSGLLAVLVWSIGQGLSWRPLLTAGAILAAVWRSQQIGRGLSYTVLRTVGWEAVLKASLTFILAGAGMFIGWVIMPVFQAVGIGALMGGFSGWLIGDSVWNYNPRIHWDRVGAGAIVLLFAWLAYLGGNWIGESWLGQSSAKWITALATWADGQGIDRLWISAVAGALGGGFAGALAGGLIEVLAEFFGFRK
jgi:serine/threonine protein kinase